MAELLRLRDDGLSWREIDGEVVALEAERSLYLASNAAGAVLWQRLADGGASRDDLARVLQDRWPIDAERAERDVDAFIAEARGHGLLR
jgi:Coenzyme PQQ synthesis protein D (PqqD)